MIKGFKTSEFFLILLVALFAIAVSTGLLTSAKVKDATTAVQQTTEAAPALIASVKELIASLAPLAGLAGLAWAYLRRRTELKRDEYAIQAGQSKAASDIARVNAARDVALAKLSQKENAR